MIENRIKIGNSDQRHDFEALDADVVLENSPPNDAKPKGWEKKIKKTKE